MSTERDELAELVYDAWREEEPRDTAEIAADAILAAGYRKPRQVTTVEELDALPGGSIIRDAKGFAWQKYNRPISDKPAWFPATRDDGFYFSSNFVDDERTPATVLHVGAE